MDLTPAEDIAASALIAQLVAAHQQRRISSNAFWNALDCVRSHRRDLGDEHLRHALGVIEGLVRALVAFPKSGGALEVFAREVADVVEQKTGNSVTRRSLSISVATQTDTAVTASVASAATQTDVAAPRTTFSVAAQTDAPTRLACKSVATQSDAPVAPAQQSVGIQTDVAVAKLYVAATTQTQTAGQNPRTTATTQKDLSGHALYSSPADSDFANTPLPDKALPLPGAVVDKIERPKAAPAASIAPTSSRHNPESQHPPKHDLPIATHVSSREGPPRLDSLPLTLPESQTAQESHNLSDVADSASPPAEHPANLIPWEVRYPRYSSFKAALTSTAAASGQQIDNEYIKSSRDVIALAGTWETDFTPEDRRTVRLSGGKIIFRAQTKHRVHKAVASYKTSTDELLNWVALILKRPVNTDGTILLRDLEQKLNASVRSRFKGFSPPLHVAHALDTAIVLREMVCKWYHNMQVAAEAGRVDCDGSLELTRLSEDSNKHRYFLAQLKKTQTAFKAQQLNHGKHERRSTGGKKELAPRNASVGMVLKEVDEKSAVVQVPTDERAIVSTDNRDPLVTQKKSPEQKQAATPLVTGEVPHLDVQGYIAQVLATTKTGEKEVGAAMEMERLIMTQYDLLDSIARDAYWTLVENSTCETEITITAVQEQIMTGSFTTDLDMSWFHNGDEILEASVDVQNAVRGGVRGYLKLGAFLMIEITGNSTRETILSRHAGGVKELMLREMGYYLANPRSRITHALLDLLCETIRLREAFCDWYDLEFPQHHKGEIFPVQDTFVHREFASIQRQMLLLLETRLEADEAASKQYQDAETASRQHGPKFEVEGIELRVSEDPATGVGPHATLKNECSSGTHSTKNKRTALKAAGVLEPTVALYLQAPSKASEESEINRDVGEVSLAVSDTDEMFDDGQYRTLRDIERENMKRERQREMSKLKGELSELLKEQQNEPCIAEVKAAAQVEIKTLEDMVHSARETILYGETIETSEFYHSLQTNELAKSCTSIWYTGGRGSCRAIAIPTRIQVAVQDYMSSGAAILHMLRLPVLHGDARSRSMRESSRTKVEGLLPLTRNFLNARMGKVSEEMVASLRKTIELREEVCDWYEALPLPIPGPLQELTAGNRYFVSILRQASEWLEKRQSEQGANGWVKLPSFE